MTKKIFYKTTGGYRTCTYCDCSYMCNICACNSAKFHQIKLDPSLKYLKADWDYPLGTDQLGRCELSRLIYGARYAIGMSIPMLLILGILGLIIGTFSVCAGENDGQDNYVYL